MESILSQIFTSDYNRTSFEDNVLKPVFLNSVKDFVLYDEDGEQEVELTDTEKRTAKKVVKYGEFQTHDNRKIELYEVTVEDFRQVKIARVGLGALVKKLIIGNNAVFATFKYEDVTNKHWRFSFIAYDSFFEEGQVQTKETNPKRYTYVFGDEDETYRTAIDRFAALDSKFQIKVKDIQDAFAVEAMSKEFFDEYRETHYAKFVKFLTGEEFQKKGGKFQLVEVQNPSPFLASVFNGDKKEARDFCKKLLGQIVFLYFIQKKGWLGATDTNYKEGNGDKNFIQNFYKQAGENDTFYPLWLSKLFYDTLNQKRTDDDFTMPDGKVVKIPYLNGGLFEKVSEKFDHLAFPSELFTDLFEFFNRFNFTIYENSPEEHTIAVDPEMLGHIFENLLEDNKDKGAFYTPKEIVQYMTQESLIEYLVTHLGENAKNGISQFVKQKDKEALTDTQLNEINTLLDKVKICDPAIGSGAFPMGLLHEIFALKERIAFDLGFKVWSPAIVKENIIQNSIYGVDIEKGAVDIAQLRFWLSLIVDEEEPKPLPNLAYKIVVGNSLVGKFENEIVEIDWSTDDTSAGFFAQELINEKTDLLKTISSKQKDFFSADSNQKDTLKKEIRDLKLDILSKQLALMIETKGYQKQTGKKLTKRETEKWLETEGWKRTLQKVNTLKTNNKPFNHFDWRLDFPEILNPIVTENTGFDIVIGNPPYLRVQGLRENDSKLTDYISNNYVSATGSFDLYAVFTEVSLALTKYNGILNFIMPVKWTNAAFGKGLRSFLKNQNAVSKIISFSSHQVFNASTYTGLQWFKRDSLFANYIELDRELNTTKDLNNYLNNINDSNLAKIDVTKLTDKPWVLVDSATSFILEILSKNNRKIGDVFEKIFQGVATSRDSVYFLYDCIVLENIVIGYSKELQKTVKIEIELVKPLLKGDDVTRYKKLNTDRYLIFPYFFENDNQIRKVQLLSEEYFKTQYPLGYGYFKSVEQVLRNREKGRFDIDGEWFQFGRKQGILFAENEKLIAPDISMGGNFAYDDKGEYYSTTTNYGYVKKKNISESYLYFLALLNSKLLWFYIVNTGTVLAGGYFRFKPDYLKPFPIPNEADTGSVKILELLVRLVMKLKNRQSKINVAEVKNEIIAKYFEELIDGCVFELYFKDHMQTNDIAISALVEKEVNNIFGDENFDSIDNNKKAKLVWELYETLTHPDHPVRNKILKFPIVSPDILKPILQS